MTAEKYMKNKFSYFFLSLMGCYKIDKNVLETSKKLLNNENSLCIFIEGKVNNHNMAKPKVGALYIEREVGDSCLLPVRIRYSNGGLRKTAEIIFKQNFRHEHFSSDLQPLANELLKRIRR
jgi:hypothetical protein